MADIPVSIDATKAKEQYEAFLKQVGSRPAVVPLSVSSSSVGGSGMPSSVPSVGTGGVSTYGGGGIGVSPAIASMMGGGGGGFNGGVTTAAPAGDDEPAPRRRRGRMGWQEASRRLDAWTIANADKIEYAGLDTPPDGPYRSQSLRPGDMMTTGPGVAGASAVDRAAERIAAATERAATRAANNATRGSLGTWRDQQRGTPFAWDTIASLEANPIVPPPPRTFRGNFMQGLMGSGMTGEGVGGTLGAMASLTSGPMGLFFAATGAAMNLQAAREAGSRPGMARTQAEYLRSRAQADFTADTFVPGSTLVGMLAPGNADPLTRRFNTEALAERQEMRRESNRSWTEVTAQESVRRFSEAGAASGGEYGRSLAERRGGIQSRATSQRSEIDAQITDLAAVNRSVMAEANARRFSPGLTQAERTLVNARRDRIGALVDERENVGAQESFDIRALERQDRISREQQVLGAAGAAGRSNALAAANRSPAFDRPIASMRADLQALADNNRAQERFARREGLQAPDVLAGRERANRADEAYRQSVLDTAIQDRTVERRYEVGQYEARFAEASGILAGQTPGRAGLAAMRRRNAATVERLQGTGDLNQSVVARNVFNAEEQVAEQQVARSEAIPTAALAFRNERLGILTNRNLRFEERARQAQVQDIVRSTQMEALGAANAGRADMLPGIFRGGQLQVQAQAQQYLASFRAQEVGNVGRTASTADPSETLRSFKDAAEQLKKVPTADELRTIVNEAVEKATQVK